jgi:GH15 family glucan-1,4-alpha-glucosidase
MRMPHRFLEGAKDVFARTVSAASPCAGADYKTETAPLACDGPFSEFPAIEDYGIIGDCRAAALVSKQGSIDWLCWPRFDKPAIFAALLDREKGGHWQIVALSAGKAISSEQIERQYVPETNVLQTRLSTESGVAVLTDLMSGAAQLLHQPTLVPDHEIIRCLETVSGEVEVEITFIPRADYGARAVRIRQAGKLGLRFQVGKGVYWLRGSVPLELEDGKASTRVTIRSGESVQFSLSYSEEAPAVLPRVDKLILNRVQGSIDRWQAWAKGADYDGSYRDEVIRSALALKLMSYAPSGAIIAAPTTSLPERIGGGLNWDYRFCWLRDSSLTIRALLELGYWHEATDFLDWMLHATRLTQPELRILYTLYGDKPERERTLDHLSGYKGSRPVRIGNAARDQCQLDVYGEVIDAAAQYAFHGGKLDREMQKVLVGLGDHVVAHWDLPDEGIWEPRTGPENHTHSRLLCWTALDRLITLHQQGKIQRAPVGEYKKNAEAIRQQIKTRGWNENLESYVSVLDGDKLDSSLLLMAWYGFERADSPRMQGTYRAIRQRLGTSEGLLYRYETYPREGTFAICGFWETEFLALGGGTLGEAQEMFDRLIRFRNDLGLYGEEIDPQSGAALGNFPQAFTHVGLIGAALSIRQREKGEQQLAHRAGDANQHGPKPGVKA